MDVEVEVTGITATLSELTGRSTAYVTYHALNGSKDANVGKVLQVDLLNDGSVADAQTYAFMAARGKSEASSLLEVHHLLDSNTFLYGGRGQYLEDSSSGLGTLKVDWSDAGNDFGFFAVYSAEDKCSDQAGQLSYGPGTAKSFPSSKWQVLS